MMKIVRLSAATRIALIVAALLAPFFVPQVLAQPDPAKVLRISFPVAETGFDPVKIHDLYSSEVVNSIFENVVTYDYLARPPKLVPGAAESMPIISDSGKTYTIKLKKGIYFSPDPIFKGAKREMVADDVVFSLKRHMDVKLKPVWKFLLDGKIVGLDELSEAGKKAGKFDYNAPVEGLKALDKYTVQIKLKETDHNFNYILAHTPMVIVAREVIEAAGDDTNSKPVGTGAYMLGKWARASKIELLANPNYRGFIWDFQSSDPADQQFIAEMKGKKMPQIGKIEINIITEDQPSLLAFKSKAIDFLRLRPAVADQAMNGAEINAELKAMGARVQRFPESEITYQYFNMQDPIVGGLEKHKIALRRAISMAWNNPEYMKVIRKGQAVQAHYLVPNGIAGHNEKYRTNSFDYDPEFANKLLDRYGYKKDKDGYRTMPDGSPLLVKWTNDPTETYRAMAELWKKGMDAIGVRFEFQPMPFSEALKKEKECKLQMRGAAWIADYPDGDNFTGLLYGPNTGESNNACFKHPEYDKIYAQTRTMPNGPERDKLYMDLQRIVEVYAPWRMDDSRLFNGLIHSNLKGFKKHPIYHGGYHNFDIEKR